jgi:hypothetical protein
MEQKGRDEPRLDELGAALMARPLARVERIAGVFFLAMIFSYAWVAPAVYRYATQGYADFSAFYTAAKMVQLGEGRRLYDLAVQTEVQKQFSHAAVVRNRALPYMRLPFEAALFLPFAHLSYQTAYLAWAVVNLALVASAAIIVRARIAGLEEIPRWVYYPAYFAFCPLAYGLALGQDLGLVVLLFALITVSLVGQRDFRAGCMLGLALIKFHLVLPFLFVLLLKRRLRALAGFVSVGILLAVLSAAIVGVRGLLEYPLYLFRLNQVPAAAAIFPGMMPNLRGLLEGWGSPMRSSLALDLVTGILSLALLIWAARQWHTHSPGSKVYLGGLALALVATVLAGYHTFSYDLSLLCPVVLLSAWIGLKDYQLDARTRKLLAVPAAALLCAPLYLMSMQLLGRLNVMGVFLLVLAMGWSRTVEAWMGPAAGSCGPR